jgi:arylsulfatase A-like enzyme
VPRRIALLAILPAFLAVSCAGPADNSASARPNVILYVIDGAAADRMSVYGYDRHTTPNLERLAAEGVVFENAYSNSSTTKTSVPSFMTSLHSSVLGGVASATDTLPPQAVTMAERMRKAGYVTEVLTSNPYCGRISGLDRGVDVMEDARRAPSISSSVLLHREFWRLREARPGVLYWAHVQPTDVHRPWELGGRSPGTTAATREMRAGEDRLVDLAGDLYDECMAFQDRSLGRLVERLEKSGERDRTLLIVAADHSHFAAGLPLHAEGAPQWPAPVLASHKTRIPLIFVWPGKIAPGRRITGQVSLIDLLPTVLDLAGLPPPEIAQGRSLAPLLLGQRGWKPRPVVFDEFYTDGQDLWGSLEVVDGRWGASLRIDTRPDEKRPQRDRFRPAPLLVFDIERDPHAFRSLHVERPDLVRKYSKMLGRIWTEHRALAAKFNRAGRTQMTPEQAEALRSLGYIR